MKYEELGHSGINVSPISLGCMGFGRPNPNFLTWTIPGVDHAQNIIHHALDLGINYFDTANVYTNGDSEEYLGQALRNLGVKREDVVIETKVFFNEDKLSSQAIEREIDGSLQRLGMDYVDVYMIHRFDYDHPIEETMEALNGLVKAGKVRALGASAMFGYQVYNMQRVALENGWEPFSVMQNHYSLIYREDERDLIPVCKQFDISLAPYSPLAAGHLGRPTWQGESERSRVDTVMQKKYDAFEKVDMPIIARVVELARRYGVSMAQIALAWQWAKGIQSPVLGSIRTDHLDDAVAALNVKLSLDDIAYLEELYQPHAVVGALSPGGPERIER
ncbi:MAG: aldo/keto reductase [Actinomycetaceae bacterium]|nr:aldo/keto reductase [Actinomycetaceae bacterium]